MLADRADLFGFYVCVEILKEAIEAMETVVLIGCSFQKQDAPCAVWFFLP